MIDTRGTFASWSIVVVNLALLALIAPRSSRFQHRRRTIPSPSIRFRSVRWVPCRSRLSGSRRGSGTYAAVSSDADIEITAVNPSGHSLSHEPLTIHRSGANSGTAAIATDANGKALPVPRQPPRYRLRDRIGFWGKRQSRRRSDQLD